MIPLIQRLRAEADRQAALAPDADQGRHIRNGSLARVKSVFRMVGHHANVALDLRAAADALERLTAVLDDVSGCPICSRCPYEADDVLRAVGARKVQS